MDRRTLEALTAQSGREALASSIYLAMAHWANYRAFSGSERWFLKASQEERDHMQEFLRFVNEYGDQLPTIPAVSAQTAQAYGSLLEVFQAALTLEIQVTDHIKTLASLADEAGDQEVEAFLQWFLREQIDSVSQYRTLVQLLETCGEDVGALLLADQQIGKLAEA
jgi:ferritin